MTFHAVPVGVVVRAMRLKDCLIYLWFNENCTSAIQLIVYEGIKQRFGNILLSSIVLDHFDIVSILDSLVAVLGIKIDELDSVGRYSPPVLFDS